MSALAKAEDADADVAERRHLSVAECFLYKAPAKRSNGGHRAEDWDLGNPNFTGRLELVGVGTTLEIRVSPAAGGPAACCCPVRCGAGAPPTDAVVDAVVDSSRYFVLRCEDAGGRHAYVGLGFREREAAFDFKGCLAEFRRGADREREADAAAAARAAEPPVDLSLRGTLSLALGGGGGDAAARPGRRTGARGGAVPTLAPPPARPAAAPPATGLGWATFDDPVGDPVAARDDDDDDDTFGEFVGPPGQ